MLVTGGQLLPPSVRLREAAPITPVIGRAEDVGWTNLRGNHLNRDLTYEQWLKHVQLSFYLYRTNPLARRIIEMDVAMLVGGGVGVTSRHPETLAALEDYWTNRYNRWPKNIYRRVRDLLIYGEWLHVPVTTRAGKVFTNILQPIVVKDVMVSPASHEIIDRVILASAQDGQQDRSLTVIGPTFDPSTEELGKLVGQVHFFGINRTTDSQRGIGELYTLIDSLDIFEEMMFNRAEKVSQMSSIWYDLTLEGYNQTQIDDFLKKEVGSLPPKSGTVWGHNEKAKIEARFPQTGANDQVQDVQMQKSHIVSAAGFPGTWFDDASAGRAVGAEMAEPAFRTIQSLQDQLAGALQDETDYALQQWEAHNDTFHPEEYALTFPQANVRDIQRIGPAIFRLSQGADLAVKGGFMSTDQAAATFIGQLNRLGLSDLPLRIDGMFDNPELAKKAKAMLPSKPGGGLPPVGGRPSDQPGQPGQAGGDNASGTNGPQAG